MDLKAIESYLNSVEDHLEKLGLPEQLRKQAEKLTTLYSKYDNIKSHIVPSAYADTKALLSKIKDIESHIIEIAGGYDSDNLPINPFELVETQKYLLAENTGELYILEKMLKDYNQSMQQEHPTWDFSYFRQLEDGFKLYNATSFTTSNEAEKKLINQHVEKEGSFITQFPLNPAIFCIIHLQELSIQLLDYQIKNML